MQITPDFSAWVLANGQNSLHSCMSWHVYGCLGLFLIISLLYSWKLYLFVRQKQEMVPSEEFLPYVKLRKSSSSRGPGLGGVSVGNTLEWLAGILIEKSSLPSVGIASLPPRYKWKTTKNENATSWRPTIKSPQSQKAALSVLNLAALLPMGATVS